MKIGEEKTLPIQYLMTDYAESNIYRSNSHIDNNIVWITASACIHTVQTTAIYIMDVF